MEKKYTEYLKKMEKKRKKGKRRVKKFRNFKSSDKTYLFNSISSSPIPGPMGTNPVNISKLS